MRVDGISLVDFLSLSYLITWFISDLIGGPGPTFMPSVDMACSELRNAGASVSWHFIDCFCCEVFLM